MLGGALDTILALTGLQAGGQAAGNVAADVGALVGWGAASFAFGALVGASEILSRYRDEPLQTISSRYGVAYLGLNGAISVIAFLLLDRYSAQIFPTMGNDLFLLAVVGGFGAMAVLRSKLFTFRAADGTEYAIGPAIVVETILQSIDRKIDRHRAAQRLTKVFSALSGQTDFGRTAQFLEASLLSFQNLTPDDKAEIAGIIDEYRKETDWPASLKIMAVGFAFLTIAGEDNFEKVVQRLKQFLKEGDPEPKPANPRSG